MGRSEFWQKKPLVIESMKFDGSEASALLIAVWAGGKAQYRVADEEHYVDIPTLEGVMRASRGDYVIKGVKGEFYPCKPDIFEASYERV